MRILSLVVCALLACAPALAQQSQPPELPSAPSATLAPKPAPSPAPPANTQPPTAQPANPPAANPDAKPAAPPASQQSTTTAEPRSKAGQAPTANGSTGDESNDSSVTTIRRRVNEVPVIFTVTDKHGHFVRDLKQADVSVLDDHKPPQAVMSFRAETDLPLRVGLLVDASGSVRERFKFEQESAVEFLNQIMRPRRDQSFVLSFDSTATVEQDFTDNVEALSRAIRALRPGGGTALYDAVYYACRDKLGKVNAGESVRRAIVLLTDGEDNQSRVTREEAIEMAERAEVIIYAISTNDSGMKGTRGDKVLERMADATGGRAFFPFKLEDIANYFSEIQAELRSQYALSYRPADFQTDGRFHAIEILASKKNLHVRARKGYYAPKQ